MFRRIPCACVPLFGVCVVQAMAQTPIGTQFTYQGQLKAFGMPAVSNADFEFALFEAADGGSQIGATASVDDVGLVNGLFTVSLDFGPEAFDGDARWIEVAVRSPAGAGGFTTLTPRQPITAAPYATQTRGIFVDTAGNVGIGTTLPFAKLHMQASEDSDVLLATRTGGLPTHYLFIDESGNGSMQLRDANNVTRVNLAAGDSTFFNNGNVGIGTSTPLAKLDVRDGDISVGGSILLGNSFSGSSPEFLAAAGHENLLLLRGNVDGDGTTDAGTGFTSRRLSEGVYVLTFDPPLGDPSLTVTAHRPQGDALRVAQVEVLFGTGARITIQFAGSSELTDSDFSFCAMGRR